MSAVSANYPIDPMHLPQGVDAQLLNYLSPKELLVSSLVSKHWNNKISNSAVIWKAKADSLECLPTKGAVASKIIALSDIAKQHLPSLTIPVKTAREFDMIGNPIMFGYSKLSQEEQDKVMKDLETEMYAKLKISKNLSTYFSTILSLYKVKRATIEEVEAAAVRLEEKFGRDNAWLSVAMVCLELNQSDYVMHLLKTKLKNNPDIAQILVPIVKGLCEKGKFIEAIHFFKEHHQPERDDADLGYILQANDCVNYISHFLLESTDPSSVDAQELLIDSLFTQRGRGFDAQKLEKITTLMKVLHKSNQHLRMKELFYKHQHFIETCDPKRNSYYLIELYFLIQDREKASEVAKKTGDSMALCDLVMMYRQYAPNEQQKIDEIISQLKS